MQRGDAMRCVGAWTLAKHQHKCSWKVPGMTSWRCSHIRPNSSSFITYQVTAQLLEVLANKVREAAITRRGNHRTGAGAKQRWSAAAKLDVTGSVSVEVATAPSWEKTGKRLLMLPCSLSRVMTTHNPLLRDGAYRTAVDLPDPAHHAGQHLH
jgi:hypothetical protein